MNFDTMPVWVRVRLLPCLLLILGSAVMAVPVRAHSPFKLQPSQLQPFKLQTITLPSSPIAQTSQTSNADRLLDAGDRQYHNTQFREALKTYQQALSAYQQANNRAGVGDTLTHMGLAHCRLSQYQRSLDALQQALKVQEAVRDRAANGKTDADITTFLRSRDRIRYVLDSLGLVYYELARYPKALEFYQQALNMSGRGLSYYGWDGQLFNQIGNVYFKLGQYPKALEYYQQALVVVDEVGYPLGRDNRARLKPPGEIQDIIYGWERRFRNHELVDRSLQPNYHEPVRLHPWARSLLATTYNNLGTFYAVAGTHSQSVQFYLKALDVSRFVDAPLLQGVILNSVGDAYSHMGEQSTAIEFYEKALTIGKKTGDRALEGTTLNKMGASFLQAGSVSQAATTLSSAVAIWESLRPGLTDPNLVSLFETQLETYNRLQTALVAQQKPEQALEIAERGRARAFVELLAKRLGTTSPLDVREPQSAPTAAAIKQIAKQQNATLVEYAVIPDDALYIWVISPTGTIAFRQVDLKPALQRSSLSDLVATVRLNAIDVRGRGVQTERKTTSSRPFSSSLARPGLQQLHQLLIAPIADLLPQDPNAHVIFIPQDALFLVPFAALQDATGSYLIERHTLTIAPSIQVLAFTHQQRQQQAAIDNQPKRTTLSAHQPLIVGNPTMPRVSVMAGVPPEQLADLPGAEREARAIALLLNTQPLIGKTATKVTVMRQMGNASLIHLATHGLLDDFKGLGFPGAVALAPSSGDDGLLTADEILTLKLQAEMVVLSACDTGRGRITGDGVIGLSRALMAAGVPTVIVSLWSIPDAPTAALMTAFYQNLQTSPDKAQALRQATLTTLKKYPNPEDWAAFTLLGETR